MRRVRAEHAGVQFQQLPMFMTPREIMAKYQPLDGDREDVVDDWDADYEETRPETDAELWDRKFDETHEKDHTGDEYWADDNNAPSLHDSVRDEGVRNPISLQFPDRVGSQGKPQVLGGHHRLVVAEAYRPDDLVPVEHFKNPRRAQKSLKGRY